MAASMVSSFTVAEPHRTVLPRDKMAGVTSPESRSQPSFWSILAQKAKSVVLLEDDGPAVNDSLPRTSSLSPKHESTPVTEQSPAMKQVTPPGKQVNVGRPLQKSLDAIASSLSLLGDTLGTAIEEGFQFMEGKPAIVTTGTPEESKSLQRSPSIWKKVESVRASQQILNSEDGTSGDIQLKASRDVAMAMASKAKLLLRELKTVKAEQSFLKGRCAQLEEENRQLREGANQGDDLVWQQLESLLAEKQRLAQENAIYARENQLLHEVVEYHHLELQDVALLDERLTGAAENFSMSSNDQSFHYR